MTLMEVGDEIHLSEYLYKYEEMVRYVLEEASFANLHSQQTNMLLKAELRKAETAWYEYYVRNQRAPDYAFLQQQLTNFGVYRLDLFDCRDQELTNDNFVHYFIEFLKSEKLLSGILFSEVDLHFIERYEREKARSYFEERNQYLKGYEEDRISVNETMQRLGYRQLKKQFLEDELVSSYRRRSEK